MMKRLFLLAPVFLSACSPVFNTDAFTLDYINLYPDSTIGCDVKEPYVMCYQMSLAGDGNKGLWIYEDETFFAINGKALTVAEKIGRPRYPNANNVDIPEVLEQF